MSGLPSTEMDQAPCDLAFNVVGKNIAIRRHFDDADGELDLAFLL